MRHPESNTDLDAQLHLQTVMVSWKGRDWPQAVLGHSAGLVKANRTQNRVHGTVDKAL